MSRKLKPKQKRAAQMLAFGHKNVTIASLLKIRPETLSRWKRNPEFRAEIDAHAHVELEVMQRRLAVLPQAAIAALWDELRDTRYGGRRVQVALYVLNRCGVLHLLQAGAAPGENAVENVSFSALSTSPSVASMPSAASDVTPYSAMPQGTIPA